MKPSRGEAARADASPRALRRLRLAHGLGTALALVALPGAGALVLHRAGLVGAGGFLEVLPWSVAALALWATLRLLVAVLDRWTTGVRSAFDHRGWSAGAAIAAVWNGLNLLACGAGLLTLATLVQGGPLVAYQLGALALGPLPLALFTWSRLHRLAGHELVGQPAAASGDPFAREHRALLEVLVVVTCWLLTPFVGGGVAAGGIWRRTSGPRRAVVPAMIVSGFLVTTLVIHPLVYHPAWPPDGPRLALYSLLTWFTGSCLLLMRRGALAGRAG